MTFIINNRMWHIEFVNAASEKLHRSDGSLTVGVTDGNDDCVYLSDLLSGAFLKKVLCHELCHCFMMSYNISIPIEQEEESKETKEFKVGETWEVDGKFKVTVNSVIATDYRNQFDESNPAAVYVINYTYENIGLKEDLYVNFESKVVDNAGKVASSYPGDTEKYPESVPTGAFCEAEVTIGVENAGSFKDYVSIYDDDYNEYSAIFNLEVQ